MALIRVLEIENFRAIKRLRWLPGEGVNCLVGAGDTGKSTILQLLAGLEQPTDDTLIYLSGPEPMVETLEQNLLKKAVQKRQVVGDYFPGYPGI